MAELVLPPLLQVIFEKLASPLIQTLGDKCGLNENFKKIEQILPMIQAVVESAEKRQVTDKVVRIWISQLKDTVDKAVDYLEDFTNKAYPYLKLEEKYDIDTKWLSVRSVSSSTEKVRRVLEALETAAAEGLQNLHLKEAGQGANAISDDRATGSFVVESEVFGRDKDRQRITDLLLNVCVDEDQRNLPAVTIVGIGGMGKTTLAQLAYYDDKVVKHFELRLWLFVSDVFDVEKILRRVIESATGERCNLSEMDVMQSKFWQILHKKRYLIVFDDVWNEDEEKWDKLKPLFQGGASGSKILVTTRSEKVAMIVDPNQLSSYYLKGLGDADCWALFKRRAFCQGDEDKYPNLLQIGKHMIGKCSGVPLAAKTLGSLMRFKRKEDEWLVVQNSDLWNLDICNQIGILPSLMLSYLHLPSHLKYCFTFCCVFPKQYWIEREKLIWIWMAQGLIQSQVGTEPEDTGDDYFRELSWMSFFEEMEIDGYGEDEMKMYKVHDLFYDLARSLTRNDIITLESSGISPSNISQIRHVSIESTALHQLAENLHQAQHLRSLILLSSGGYDVAVHPKMFASFTYLRVLIVSYCNIQLPESLGDLQCLKYLDQSNSGIKSLPIRVNLLRSMLTLNLSNCYNLQQLPELHNMQNLRHLNIEGCDRLAHMPNGIEDLPQLQTLPMYIVSRLSHLQVLGPLNLRRQLKIKHLENVRNTQEAKEANISKKTHLKSLGLCWGYDDSNLIMNPISRGSLSWLQMGKKNDEPQPSRRDPMDGKLAEEVLACLRPHDNLESLHVLGYPGVLFPRTFSKWLLPNLSTIELINCRELLWLPILGHLLTLKTLRIEGMNKVEEIGPEFYGEGSNVAFPSLQELHIKDFPVLKVWYSEDDQCIFPLLRKLTIKNCPNLIQLPIFLSIQHLTLHACNTRILDPISKSTSLLTLLIQEFSELFTLPEEILQNNSLLLSLEIISCPNLHSLPLEFQTLNFLETLTLRWCQNLSSLPNGFQNLTALKTLEITECHGISILGEEIGGLKSLKTLSIENCSNLGFISMGLQHLTALEHLTIMYCSSLTSLPNGFQHLSSLKCLTLLNCPELQLLPESLKYATRLQRLELHSCFNLRSLPEWFDKLSALRSFAISDCQNVTSLPVAFRQLTALQHLSVHRCPILARRCWLKNGVDWWKIAHVPHVYIPELS
uniref:disease resistance protein RGA2-like n=1 Tax=Erigeron canadensis TaxID=72917 RepID=UPI001CB89A86|nr:disease resistance protein RGA2-like [Erigeron canadensis]